jgi:hypothetical protein
MTRRERARGIGLLFFSLLGASVPGGAEAGEGDVAAARALFAEARKLAGAGDYAAACPRFADSYKLDPGIGTSFNLADCEEHLGRTASAWARFLDVAAATKAAGQLERERVARARAAALEPRLSKLVIEVPSPSPGITVRRDGDLVPERLWGVTLPIDPGAHALEASAPGRRPWKSDVAIAPTPDLTSISVPALVADPPPAARAGGPARAAVPGAPRGSTTDEAHRIPRLSLWLGGFGLASVATGTVFAVLMERDNSQAQTLCTNPGYVCSDPGDVPRHAQLLTAAKRERAIFYVGTGVGAVAIVAAGSWWWRASHAPERTSKGGVSLVAAPTLSTSGAQVSLEAVW